MSDRTRLLTYRDQRQRARYCWHALRGDATTQWVHISSEDIRELLADAHSIGSAVPDGSEDIHEQGCYDGAWRTYRCDVGYLAATHRLATQSMLKARLDALWGVVVRHGAEPDEHSDSGRLYRRCADDRRDWDSYEGRADHAVHGV